LGCSLYFEDQRTGYACYYIERIAVCEYDTTPQKYHVQEYRMSRRRDDGQKARCVVKGQNNTALLLFYEIFLHYNLTLKSLVEYAEICYTVRQGNG
jgi:hypothetical protein